MNRKNSKKLERAMGTIIRIIADHSVNKETSLRNFPPGEAMDQLKKMAGELKISVDQYYNNWQKSVKEAAGTVNLKSFDLGQAQKNAEKAAEGLKTFAFKGDTKKKKNQLLVPADFQAAPRY